MANLGRRVDERDWSGAVPAAWEAGVRYFDTAPHYGLGLAERRLAATLPEGAIVSTKVGRLLVPRENPDGREDDEGFAVPADLRRARDYSRDGVRRSLESSLERLEMDRVDIVFVHDPDEHEQPALEGAFPALEALRSQGAITSYGAGMNQSAMLARFVERTESDVVMLAGRYTLLDQSALDDLLPGALARDVSVVAAGVFNSGILATHPPRSTATYDYERAPEGIVGRATRIAAVCERHGTSLPAAAAQFPLGHPAVATVCLGARSAAQVERNAALFDAEIPAPLWEELKTEGLLREDAPTP